MYVHVQTNGRCWYLSRVATGTNYHRGHVMKIMNRSSPKKEQDLSLFSHGSYRRLRSHSSGGTEYIQKAELHSCVRILHVHVHVLTGNDLPCALIPNRRIHTSAKSTTTANITMFLYPSIFYIQPQTLPIRSIVYYYPRVFCCRCSSKLRNPTTWIPTK